MTIERLETKLDEAIDHIQQLKGQALINQQVIAMLLTGANTEVRGAIKTLVDDVTDYPDALDPSYLEGCRAQAKWFLDALNSLPAAPRG